MRQTLIPAFLLLLGSAVLGATVFHEPLAKAASSIPSVLVSNSKTSPVPVQEVNTDTSGFIKTHEQGTANVNVTNSQLSVAPAAPVTGGGDAIIRLTSGSPVANTPVTATAVSIHMTSGVSALGLYHNGNKVAQFQGPANFGTDTINLALTRPISFDSILCSNPSGTPSSDGCGVSWIGAQP